MPDPAPSNPVNPLSLSVEELARMLSAAGGKKITAHQIQLIVETGAPTVDGRINLVHFAAWLNRRLKERDGD